MVSHLLKFFGRICQTLFFVIYGTCLYESGSLLFPLMGGPPQILHSLYERSALLSNQVLNLHKMGH